MKDYLNNIPFLEEILLAKEQTQYVKIILLDWAERPIQDLVGYATDGSVNIDGGSSLRRTASLDMYLDNVENNITNPNFLLSINKKVKLEIGITNRTQKYIEEPIIWFPIGVFIISNISINHDANGFSISLQLKDKMSLLNGESGGVLPATVRFDEIEEVDADGNIHVSYPTIFQIITELVNHFGKEQLGKILISDIDTQIKKVMSWHGKGDLYYYKNENQENILTTNITEAKEHANYQVFHPNDNVGYVFSDFIFNGKELIGNAGETVCSVLDKIKNLLGNYEYFYDIDGNFIFQEIKNYLNVSQSTTELKKIENSDYLLDISKGKSCYDFKDSFGVVSYSNSPQFNMIKNDFVVWGEKEVSGLKLPIRYHLAIDKKPENSTHKVVKVLEDGLKKAKGVRTVAKITDLPDKESVVLFFVEEDNKIYKWNEEKKDFLPTELKLIEVTSTDWRTELYLQGAEDEAYGLETNPYYVELSNEWPKIFNIWPDEPEEKKEGETEVKNKPQDFLGDPATYDYYLDFIDSTASIGEFSIDNIGQRSKVNNDKDVHCLFPTPIPELVFIKESEKQEYLNRQENFAIVSDSIYDCLIGGTSYYSAFESIRSLLYQYTSYNESVSLQCLPLYFLEVNTRISITDVTSNINGDYVIHQIQFPLGVQGTMSISATRALEHI